MTETKHVSAGNLTVAPGTVNNAPARASSFISVTEPPPVPAWKKTRKPEEHNELTGLIHFAKTFQRPTIDVVFGVLDGAQGAYVYSLLDTVWTSALFLAAVGAKFDEANNGAVKVVASIFIFVRLVMCVFSIYMSIGGKVADNMAKVFFGGQGFVALISFITDITILAGYPIFKILFLVDIFVILFLAGPKYFLFASILMGPPREKPAADVTAPVTKDDADKPSEPSTAAPMDKEVETPKKTEQV